MVGGFKTFLRGAASMFVSNVITVSRVLTVNVCRISRICNRSVNAMNIILGHVAFRKINTEHLVTILLYATSSL